ncbi:hypothetical protein [Leptospira sarikeiensis]|uniref:Cytochrome oxidase subunit II transmembrane region profile domain-containing protein n=1 Tax=Leptospira sarikeiensis TaxID=2484943 RepID=A0A4R9KDP3_9LEPT|nr:hypothetical protein [Leptospira sarikeiensis]TGL63293.1 hypothetical protein EHQ64_04850 [Leptospira sarikeiensis]
MKSRSLNPVLIIFLSSILSAVSIFIFVATYNSPIQREQITATSTEITGLIWLVITVLLLYNAGLASFRNIFLEKFSEDQRTLETGKALLFSVFSLFLFLSGSKLGSLFRDQIEIPELLMSVPILLVAIWENYLTRKVQLKNRSFYLLISSIFQILVYISFMLSFIRLASLDGID